ncbi:MAG: hypothetical protein WCK86_10925 [Planctomycetia bacterium]
MRQYRLCLIFRRITIYREVVNRQSGRGYRTGTTLVAKSKSLPLVF